MATVLVTGIDRGLGLALVEQLNDLDTVSKVFGTIRSPSADLDALVAKSNGKIIVLKMDVTDEESIKKVVPEVEAKLEGKGLDILINNAGIAQYAPDGVKCMDNLQESLTVNVMGVHWVTRNFLPLLYKGNLKKVINMATTLGSIALMPKNIYLPAPAYKISKACINALTVEYAVNYKNEGFSFIALCPGWMKTELGGGEMADLTPAEGAKASLDIIFTPGQVYNGQMPKVLVKGWENNPGMNQYDGTNAPW
ncbi:hypothetical protein NQ176_g4864 [Zarea fungicola]|uniref:Uncharacterized protein n=1 Tax=Zarea fungicola TaxID=93591 RepID=A0ACC1NCJ3_9HYPO|nr:hypothetical protein NQ176_g4864 [Lecanicillium fungicola]